MTNCVILGIKLPNKMQHFERFINNAFPNNKDKEIILLGLTQHNKFYKWAKNLGYVENEEQLLTTNGNTLKKWFRQYVNANRKDLTRTESKKQLDNLEDWTSNSAKKTAAVYTGNLLKLAYLDNYVNGRNKTKAQLITDVRRSIFNKFTVKSHSWIVTQHKEGLISDKEYNEYNDKLTKIVELQSEKKKSKDNIREQKVLQNELFDITQNIINNNYADNIIIKNFAQLAKKVFSVKFSERWFDEVFYNSSMFELSQIFSETDVERRKAFSYNATENDEKTDESDEITETLDTMSASWDNALLKDFIDNYDDGLKLYLSTIPERNASIIGLGENALKSNYAYDTELGVPTFMDVKYVVSQLAIMGPFRDVNHFIKVVERKADTMQSLYGLGKLVIDMRNNPEFANKVYCAFAKPILNKIQISISQLEAKNKLSNNQDINSSSKLFYDLLSDSNLVGREEYLSSDDVELNKVLTHITNLNNNSELSRLDNDDIQKDIETLSNYIKKHFPSINIENIINWYFDNPKTANKKDLISLIKALKEYNDGLQTALNNENEYNSKFYLEKRNYQKYIEGLNGERNSTREAPVYNGEAINKKQRNDALFKIVKELLKVAEKNPRLNSTNAEGKMSSNIGKSSFITDFVKQLKVELENGKDGRDILKDFFSKKKYDVSDVETNMFLFGLKDRNGNIIREGLLSKNKTGEYIINENSNILKTFNISLFDGIKDENSNEGVAYQKMTKEDYLLSSILIFDSSLQFDSLSETDVNGMANFLMRIPSDASNTYAVQIQKFKTDDLYDYGDKSIIKDKISDIREELVEFYDEESQIEGKDVLSFWKNYVNELIGDNYSKNKRNYLSNENMMNLLLNKSIDNISLINIAHRNYKNNSYIPFIYNDTDKGESFVVLLKGETSNNKTFVENAKIISIRSIQKHSDKDKSLFEMLGFEEGEDFKDTTSIKPIINNFISKEEHTNIVRNWLLDNKIINRTFNKNSEIFLAFRNELWGEIQQFVTNLNNVFEKDEYGRFISKDKTKDLIDVFHYKNSIVKDGQLTGNVFKFYKLFDNGIDINSILYEILALYDVNKNSLFEEPLFIETIDGNLSINENRLNDGFIEKTDGENGYLTVGNDFQSNMYQLLSEKLDDIIDIWLNKFRDLTANKKEEFSNILGSRNISDEELFDWALNTSLAYMTFDGIFEGSAKYYKDAQTFLKRAKETQMGGTPYSGVNFGAYEDKLVDVVDEAGNTQIIKIESEGKNLLSNIPTYVNGKIVEKDLTLRSGWRAVTIKNSITNYDRIEYIRKNIYDKILKETGSKESAEKISNRIASGFTGIKANDAQSYITIEEFIRRRQADGTISQYKDLLSKLLDKNVKLEDINLDEVNQRIQAQKNVYYDLKYDEATGQHRPRQIKNAEFVLIPKLLPENSDLRKLYDIMRKYDIGQINTVETSKASNKDVLTFWNDKEEVDLLSFESQLTGKQIVNGKLVGRNIFPAVEDFYYKHLYKQLDVVDHIEDKENKAGIQLFKKIQDNYTENTKNNVDNIQEALSANIKASYNLLLDKLGWKKVGNEIVNKNGTQPLKFNTFYNECLEEFKRIGIDENILDYLQTNDAGIPYMPEWMSIVSTKLENVAQSIFNNNIIRQTLPGYHGIQISNIGFSKKLRYHPVEGENTLPVVEIMIPAYSKAIKDLIKKYGKEEALKKLNEAGLDEHIGYRIPTEGKQSIAVFKVVDFLPECYGSSIVVANEWVAQTGSDFDIDSIYSLIQEMYFDGNEIHKIKYDLSNKVTSVKNRYLDNLREKVKSASKEIKDKYEQNKDNFDELLDIGDSVGFSYDDFKKLSAIDQLTRSQRNNLITDNVIAIMKDSSSFEEVFGRSNFDDIKDAKDKTENLADLGLAKSSVYNPFDQLKFMQNAIDGRKLKAFSVNRDTFCSICNKSKVTLNNIKGKKGITYNTVRVVYNSSYDKNIAKSAYDNIEDINNGFIIEHNKLGWSNNNRNVVGRLITSYSSETTAHILDAIKKGALFNETEFTFGTFKTLIDLGIDYNTAVAFLAQPSITRINEKNNASNSIYLNDSVFPAYSVILDIAKELGIINKNENYIKQSEILNKLLNSKFKDVVEDLLNNVFYTDSSNIRNAAINTSSLINRLQGKDVGEKEGLTEEELNIRNNIFDLITTLQFDKIYNTTKNIENIARVLRPDSYGSKQIIKEVRDIADNVESYRTSKLLTVEDGRTLINAIYTEDNSLYKYLYYFYKYGTLESKNINTKLFKTEQEHFQALLNDIKNKIGRKLTNDEYIKAKKYLIHRVYNSLPILNSPVTIDEHGFVIIDKDYIINNAFEPYWKTEIGRIYGFVENEVNVPDIDINNPSKEDIQKFSKLTPAQKVLFIKSKYKIEIPFVSKVDVVKSFKNELTNKKYSYNRLFINELNVNIDSLRKEFATIFFNKDPLVKLTAVDLIKYAFVVEGYDFRKRNISKAIPNSAIMAKISENGMGILDECLKQFESLTLPSYNTIGSTDNFIRANSQLLKPKKIYAGKGKETTEEYRDLIECYDKDSHMITVPKQEKYNKLLTALGFENRDSNYVKVIFNPTNSRGGNVTYLYKIIYSKFLNNIYFVPVNLLEEFEDRRYSVNNANNEHYDYNYYINFIKDKESLDEQTLDIATRESELDEESIENIKLEFDNILKETNYEIIDELPKYKFENQTDENKIINALSTGEEKYKYQLYKFIDNINEIITHTNLSEYIVENSSEVVSKLLNLKGSLNGQTFYIPKDNGKIKVNISRYNTSALLKYQNRNKKSKVSKPTFDFYIEKFGDIAKTGKKFYKIDLIAEQSVDGALIEYDNRDSKYDYLDEVYAEDNTISEDNISTSISALIAKDIRMNARRGDNAAIKANGKFYTNGIILNNLNTLTGRTQTVYSIANKYYKETFDAINAEINNFTLNDGSSYSIDDSKLYENATSADFQRLLSLILKANHFAESLQDIYDFDMKGEDVETQREVELLKGYVSAFKNNSKLKVAINKVFNKYLTSNVSNNPLLKTSFIDSKGNKHYMLDSTDIFGDSGVLTANISDIGNIPHKQIQMVVKAANESLYSATFEGREEVRKYEEWIKNNIGEDANSIFNKIIDENGKIIQPYTDQFIEDKYRLKEELRNTELVYGKNSIEAFKKELEYKEWKLNNTEQPLVADYYKKELSILKEVFNVAGETFIKYKALIDELYYTYSDTYNLSDEQLKEKENIQNELANLLNDTDSEGNKKSPEELNKIDAIKIYKEEMATLKHEYFKYEPSEEFNQNLKYNLSIVKKFNDSHKNLTLQEKLEDLEYRTAYNWIRSNTRYRLNDEAMEALGKAYNVLNLGNPIRRKNARINALFVKKDLNGNLYDIYGNVIGTNFTEDEIKIIRDVEAEKYSPVEGNINSNVNNEDSALYKNIPEQRILTKEFWINQYIPAEEKSEAIIQRKKEIYSKINNIIAKGINHNDGVIEAKRLFDNCTQEELDELESLYDELRGLTIHRKNKNKQFEFVRNEAAFAKQYVIYSTLNKAEKRLFENIFCEKDKNGEILIDDDGKFVPNGFIYGYVKLTDKLLKEHPEWIDTKREDALKLIKENEIFEETEYYYNAIDRNQKEAIDIYNKAIADGKSIKEAEKLKNSHIDDWFKNNHIWNKYTNKWQPISIWTVRRINENGTLPGEYSFEPVGDNFDREIIEGKENKNYSTFGTNYNVSTGKYNNSKYSSIISNKDSKEHKLYTYIENLMWQGATNNTNRRFIEEGWAPRKYKIEKDAEWYTKQVLGTLGLNFRSYANRTFTELMDYEHDHDIVNPMLQLLKNKGYEELEKIPEKDSHQSDDDYNKLIGEINARNAERRKNNLELEKAVRDNDWNTVFKNYIYSSIQYNAREKIKNLIYLTIDDLKNRKVYKINAFGKVSKNKNNEYLNVDQKRNVSIFENWARRILYDEFKEISKLNKFADTLQNMSSAKYMIFNIYAGVNNVAVGTVNILGEIFAKEYFGRKEWNDACKTYRKSMFSFIKDTFSNKSDDRTVAIVKMFDILEMDRLLEFNGDTYDLQDIAKHFNTIAYSLQSGGEHFMQNTALIAILKSHRVYKDLETGKQVIGSFSEYISGIENAALTRVISGNEYLTAIFNQLKANAKRDKQLQYEYDKLKRNVVTDFFNSITDVSERKKYQDKYISLRKEMLKNDRAEFEKNKSAWDCIEYKDGYAYWSKESGLTDNDLGFLRNRAIYCNKEIHGVYDKIGAAQIEKHWWGSIVMQFKKHIWPGIMKRYNTKGYFNEQRGVFEKGSYISFVDFLGAEFKNFKSKYNDKATDESSKALSAIQTTFECIIDTIHNFKYNYELLPVWEQNNVRRSLADLCGIMAALLTVFAIYGLTDDDDLKENTLLNSTLYLADRLYGESRMYTPLGAIPEFNTQWSNPVAGKSVIEDLAKSMQIATQWMFDPDFDIIYKSGPYKGKNKLAITVKKNIPAVRTIERIKTINSSNKYYRIGDNSASQKIVKSIAKELRND